MPWVGWSNHFGWLVWPCHMCTWYGHHIYVWKTRVHCCCIISVVSHLVPSAALFGSTFQAVWGLMWTLEHMQTTWLVCAPIYTHPNEVSCCSFAACPHLIFIHHKGIQRQYDPYAQITFIWSRTSRQRFACLVKCCLNISNMSVLLQGRMCAAS
jgi:hypothetical protein